MKVLVSLKRVIDYNVSVRVKEDNSAVDLTTAKMPMSPLCEVALNEAVCLKEKSTQGCGGSIINMTSINAERATFNSVVSLSKASSKQPTALMVVDLASSGIRVNVIGPGAILTNSVTASPVLLQSILPRTALGPCGELPKAASVASLLASDDVSYICGQTIYPDDGRLTFNYTVPVSELAHHA